MTYATIRKLILWIVAILVVAGLLAWAMNASGADLGPDQDLAEAQARLTELGYPTGYSDGISGPITEGAIASYQHDRCLEPTGILDKKTWATLWARQQTGCSLYAERGQGERVDLKCMDCK